jgi:hypothetical protein
MIPGSAESSTVDLYRARSFPYEWTLEKSLHRIRAVNTTVCRAAGRWWFFAAVAEPPGHCATLLLFHAESLTGPWVYHPANPISSDVRNARGAGAIFRARGRRIRPSHALGPRGEHRFSLNEILELTPEAYRERPMLTVEPSWATAVMGTATYAQWAGIEVVDGCTMARRARPAVADGVDPVCVGSRE